MTGSGWDFNKHAAMQQPGKASIQQTSLEEAIPPGCRHRGSRELTVLHCEKDSQLMESVKNNLLKYSELASNPRSSMEDEAAVIAARHAALHKKRMAAAQAPKVCICLAFSV